jgi:hypothetical protein
MMTFFGVVLCVLVGAATIAISVASIYLAFRWASHFADKKEW